MTPVTTNSSILTALRQGTTEAHHALEAEIDFLSPALTREGYLKTLRVFAAFVSSWEKQATEHCPASLAVFWQGRQRAPLLEADLAFFAATPLDAEPRLPSINTLSSFLGALYVMEGSTLGGQVIARELESRLGLSEGNGYSYFRGRGAETGRMWKEFLGLLTEEAPALDEASVLAAARATFASFRTFYAQQIAESQ